VNVAHMHGTANHMFGTLSYCMTSTYFIDLHAVQHGHKMHQRPRRCFVLCAMYLYIMSCVVVCGQRALPCYALCTWQRA
jgi:hypothetical protein